MNKIISSSDSIRVEDVHSHFLYALTKGDEIVYIGQTSNIITRLSNHRKNKDFDNYYLRKLNSKNNFLEAYLIFKFAPLYNKSIPSNDRFLAANFGKLKLSSELNGTVIQVKVIGNLAYFDNKVHKLEMTDKAIEYKYGRY